MNKYRIPISKPFFSKLERDYILQVFDSEYLSRGYFCKKFEEKFAEYLNVKYVLGVNSGTSACHLCVLTSNIEPYHSIYIPNLTFIATPNSVSYSQIGIILGEVNEESWNLDIKFFLENKLYNKVKGIYLVDLLGNPNNIEQWYDIAKQYELIIIYDACESIGAKHKFLKQQHYCGTIGCKSAAFSFYMNKNIVSAGEGGAFVCNNEEIYDKALMLHGQYQHKTRKYYHEDIGMNYRMTEFQAAILCAQLERIEEILSEKRRVFEQYRHLFSNSHVKMQKINEGSVHSAWICGVQLKNRANVEYELEEAGIEYRRMFVPLNLNPPYEHKYPFAVSQNIYNTTLMLPSYCQLTNKEIKEIVDIILKAEEG